MLVIVYMVYRAAYDNDKQHAHMLWELDAIQSSLLQHEVSGSCNNTCDVQPVHA